MFHSHQREDCFGEKRDVTQKTVRANYNRYGLCEQERARKGSSKTKENVKKAIDFIQNKLNDLENSEPKPICEIQVGLTPEGMTTIGKEWLTELSLSEKKEYIDLLIDKLKFMKEKELYD